MGSKVMIGGGKPGRERKYQKVDKEGPGFQSSAS